MSQYEKLLNGEVLEVDFKNLTLILLNMEDINTLLIQHYYNGNYIIKVDDITVKRYKYMMRSRNEGL